MNNLITEEFELPSLGRIYGTPFDPTVKLRSMTVAEEMKRLSPTKYPYKALAEIIDDCIVDKLPISSYDMCIGDFTYLLYKLRTVTYGSDYNISYICPKCLSVEKKTISLDDLADRKYSDELKNEMFITLPKTGKQVKLRLQTPKDLDIIEKKKRDHNEKFPNDKDQTIIFTLESFIDKIDGEPFDPILGKEGLMNLPLADMNYLAVKATRFNELIGVDSVINVKCEKCGEEFKSPFRITNEFFRPDIL